MNDTHVKKQQSSKT